MKKSAIDFFSSVMRAAAQNYTKMKNLETALAFAQGCREGSAHSMEKGYVLSLEAASALILLLVATSALQLYNFRQDSAGDFFACSDAAVVLAKSHAFSGEGLQEKAGQASKLSNLCISARSQLASFSSCGKPDGAVEKF